MALTDERYREIENYLAGHDRTTKEHKMLRETFQALEEDYWWIQNAREVVKKTMYIAEVMQLKEIAHTCEQLLNDKGQT